MLSNLPTLKLAPTITMRSMICLALILFTLFNNKASFAQTRISLFDQLTATETVQLSLSTDVDALIINKKTTDYQPGSLKGPDGKSYEVAVKPRGKFRRRISDIPPLKLKLKKKLLDAEGLIDSLNELKLVLPTTLDAAGDQMVIREYLAYRMYEQLCPYAVRARLIDLYLINTNLSGQSHYVTKAILLEDEEETAARLGGQIFEAYGMTTDSLQLEATALMVMFQYMIGNTDWDILQQRNIRFFKTATGIQLPIPFDFDFSGLVDAPYATPLAGLGLRNVRERRLMANNVPTASLDQAAQILLQQQQSLLELCRTAPLEEKSKLQASTYLNSFFDSIRKEQNKR